jgi:hypothetical protein
VTIAASIRERLFGSAAVAAACAYLLPFVARGWMPHDEGMLGQSADRVLHGAIPHIDYEEPYVGALSWLYAAVFKLRGIDLLNVRWVLLATAWLALVLVYAIARRWLRPAGAAMATWVALVWSFPNCFAGLPSWWLLLCALWWAFVRSVDTQQLRYLAIAGFAAGGGGARVRPSCSAGSRSCARAVDPRASWTSAAAPACSSMRSRSLGRSKGSR